MTSLATGLCLLALASGAVVAGAALPFWRRVCSELGWVDDPGNRKIHDRPTPLAGGLTIATSLLISLAAGLLLVQCGFVFGETWQALHFDLRHRAVSLAVLGAGAGGMLGLGWWDDKYELNPGWKFGGQLVIAGLVAVGGTRIACPGLNPLFSYGLTILWILTVTNAFNFMDNMNGLCAGLAALAAGLFGGLAASQGQIPAASVCFLIMGAALGFLPYNYPQASAFLGDAGSHLLGYLVAVAAISLHLEHPGLAYPWALVSPLLVLAWPLADLAAVVVFRLRARRPFYVGDTNHLSHRLVRAGLSPAWAVALLWAAAAATGGLAFLFMG